MLVYYSNLECPLRVNNGSQLTVIEHGLLRRRSLAGADLGCRRHQSLRLYYLVDNRRGERTVADSLPMPSFSTDPNAKPSYRRAADDIGRALKVLKAEQLSEVGMFLFYYYGCEKLARLMRGVEKRIEIRYVYPKTKEEEKKQEKLKTFGTPRATEIYQYAKLMDFNISKEDIYNIFCSKNPNSARALRNQFVQEMGPTHARMIRDEAKSLVPKMQRFIKCRSSLIEYIEKLGAA